MFDMSFSEIAVIGAVALVVLGPERLPKVARTAGHLFGRLQRYVNSVKSDISREMEASEFSKLKQDVQDAARSFEHTVKEHATSIESEAKAIQQSAEKSLADPAAGTVAPVSAPGLADAVTPVGVDSLVTSVAGTDVGAAAAAAMLSDELPPLATTVPPVATATPLYEQGMFDFGIEPVRSRSLAKAEA
jgi:sec-independent protein translocase protein TatB